MAGTPWLVLPLLALPLLLGLCILRRAGVGGRGDWLFVCGAAYGTGSLVVAIVLALFVGFRLPLARFPVLGALCGLLVLGALAARTRLPPAIEPRRQHGALERFLFVASVGLCSLSIVVDAALGSRFAITVADEATHYFAKSCEIFQLGRFGSAYTLALAEGFVAAPDYPLLNPLLQVYAHVCNGGIARVDARLPIQAFMLATVLVLGGSLARWTRPGLAALLLPLAILTPTVRELAQSASADGLVAFGLLLATDGTLARQRGHASRAAPVLAIGLATMIMAKSEGTMLAILIGVANLPALVRRGDRVRALRWLALPAAVLAAHHLFNRFHGFSYVLLADYGKGNLVTRFLRQATTHSQEVFMTFTRELVFPATCTNGLFAALLLLLALAPRAMRAAGAFWPALAVGAAVLGHATLMIGTGTDLAWSLQTATPRLWMQLGPSSALSVGAALAALSR